MAIGRREAGIGEPGENCSRVDERRALVQLVELDPGDELAVAGPELVGLRRAAASPARGSDRPDAGRPTPPAAPTARRAAGGARTGSRRGRRCPRRPAAVAFASRMTMRSVRPSAGDRRLAHGRPNPARIRRRRARAPGSAGPWPRASDRRRSARPPRDRRGTGRRPAAGSAASDLLEEDRDVLARQPLDGDAIAIRALLERGAGPEERRSSRPSPATRPRRGRTGRRGSPRGPRRGASPRPRRPSTGGRPRTARGRGHPPPMTRSRWRARACRWRRRAAAGVMPASPAARTAANRPESPARGRPATSGGTRRGCAMRSSKRSSWPIGADCRMAGRLPDGTSRVPLRSCNGPAPTVVLGGDGHDRHAPHRPSRGRRAPRGGPRPGPGRHLSRARHRAPGPALLDRPAHARRSPRRRGGGPGRPGPGLSGAGRVRRGPHRRPAPAGLARDDRPQRLPHAAGTTVGARPAAGLARRRRARAGRAPEPPTAARPRPSSSGATSATPGEPGSCGCRPPIGPPSCSATSTACPIPRPPPPSADPRAPSRPRSTGGSPCCARCSRPNAGPSPRR